jgi:hypothetical protein
MIQSFLIKHDDTWCFAELLKSILPLVRCKVLRCLGMRRISNGQSDGNDLLGLFHTQSFESLDSNILFRVIATNFEFNLSPPAIGPEKVLVSAARIVAEQANVLLNCIYV